MDAETWRACEKLVALGVVLAHLGYWKDAVRHWQKALEIDTHNSNARNNLAVAYEHKGACELATEQYEAAMAVEPSSVTIRQNYNLHQRLKEGETSGEIV